MATQLEAHLRTVNESGFPLQIAISHLVNTQHPAGWNVRYAEHAWQSPNGRDSGFIDVVLENAAATCFLVIECKRVRDVERIFLAANGNNGTRHHCKCWVSRMVNNSMKFFGWEECPVDPTSKEAAFCVVRGQAANGQRPMLERIASEVILATEALAVQERGYKPPDRSELFRTYFNVIVTTAPLLMGKFDPAGISLTDGTLAAAEFEAVPYVRFRKQLADAAQPFNESYDAPYEAARARESTVFVVNANHLTDFLSEFELDNQGANRFI